MDCPRYLCNIDVATALIQSAHGIQKPHQFPDLICIFCLNGEADNTDTGACLDLTKDGQRIDHRADILKTKR